MGPLGAAEAPGAAFHSKNGLTKAGGHNNLMAPRTRALKTVDGAPLRPLINRQDRIESSTAPACSSADTMSRSHTAPKIVRLRYERRAPRFVPYLTRRRPRRRESARKPKFEDTQHTFTYLAMIYLRSVIFLATFGRPWPV